jgi:hypothetical protein
VERVVFLIEQGGERISCLLNPESVVVRRRAGLVPRAAGGPLGAPARSDDELLFVGGGLTELTLDLLFDVDLLGRGTGGRPAQGLPSTSPEPQVEDVRALTGPLVRLAESAAGPRDLPWPPPVRFIWGKAWNLPVVVTAVAERFDRFTSGGLPQRSWLRLRLLRVAEPQAAPATLGDELPELDLAALERLASAKATAEPATVHIVIGADDEEGGSAERMDLLAWRFLGTPVLWRLLALSNPWIEDPLTLSAGEPLVVPSLRPGATG